MLCYQPASTNIFILGLVSSGNMRTLRKVEQPTVNLDRKLVAKIWPHAGARRRKLVITALLTFVCSQVWEGGGGGGGEELFTNFLLLTPVCCRTQGQKGEFTKQLEFLMLRGSIPRALPHYCLQTVKRKSPQQCL